MCAPVLAAATFALGAASSIMQYQAGVDQARRQEAMFQQNRQNAIQGMTVKYGQEMKRMVQEGDVMSSKNHTLEIEGAQKEAAADATAAEFGVAGISAENVVADIRRRTATNQYNNEVNYKNIVDQLHMEGLQAQAQAKSQINSVPRGVEPSPFGMILGIGGTGLRAFGQL